MKRVGISAVGWRQVRRIVPTLVAGVCLFLLAGCTGFWSVRDDNHVPDVGSGPNWDLAALVSLADLVVKGEVVSTRATRVEVKDGWRIVTDVDIIVLECLKGEARSRLVVRTRGGLVGDTVSLVSGEPTLRAGETVWVFLTSHSDEEEGLAGHFGTVWGLFGKLTLSAGRVSEISMTEPEFVSRLERVLEGHQGTLLLLRCPHSMYRLQ